MARSGFSSTANLGVELKEPIAGGPRLERSGGTSLQPCRNSWRSPCLVEVTDIVGRPSAVTTTPERTDGECQTEKARLYHSAQRERADHRVPHDKRLTLLPARRPYEGPRHVASRSHPVVSSPLHPCPRPTTSSQER